MKTSNLINHLQVEPQDSCRSQSTDVDIGNNRASREVAVQKRSKASHLKKLECCIMGILVIGLICWLGYLTDKMTQVAEEISTLSQEKESEGKLHSQTCLQSQVNNFDK